MDDRTAKARDYCWIDPAGCWQFKRMKGGGKPRPRSVARWRRILLEAQRGKSLGRTCATSTCGEPCCINPDHLRALTKSQLGAKRTRLNADHAMRITIARQAQSTKLSMEKARDIRRRRLAGERQIDLAAEYGVSIKTVQRITWNQIWKERGPLAQLAGRD